LFLLTGTNPASPFAIGARGILREGRFASFRGWISHLPSVLFTFLSSSEGWNEIEEVYAGLTSARFLFMIHRLLSEDNLLRLSGGPPLDIGRHSGYNPFHLPSIPPPKRNSLSRSNRLLFKNREPLCTFSVCGLLKDPGPFHVIRRAPLPVLCFRHFRIASFFSPLAHVLFIPKLLLPG